MATFSNFFNLRYEYLLDLSEFNMKWVMEQFYELILFLNNE